ncbi:MAG: helix-turn-helix domain-containing protein [Deltaproteobacteria bacterium]
MARSLTSEIGQRIRQLRVSGPDGRLTQEQLAERADISVSFLSMIERGERAAHVETLASLADGLSVPIVALLSDAGDRPGEREPSLTPLAELIERQRLTRRDVERLLVVAKALFPPG